MLCVPQAFVLTSGSLDEALDESINGDMSVVSLGIILMITYGYFVLSRRPTCTHSRFLLTSAVAGSVVLGVGAGMGLVTALGVPFSNMNQVLIYVMMGIGVDGTVDVVGDAGCCAWWVTVSLDMFVVGSNKGQIGVGSVVPPTRSLPHLFTLLNTCFWCVSFPRQTPSSSPTLSTLRCARHGAAPNSVESTETLCRTTPSLWKCSRRRSPNLAPALPLPVSQILQRSCWAPSLPSLRCIGSVCTLAWRSSLCSSCRCGSHPAFTAVSVFHAHVALYLRGWLTHFAAFHCAWAGHHVLCLPRA